MLDILSYHQWAVSQEFFNRVGLLAWKLLMEDNNLSHLIKKYSDEDLVKRYDQMLLAEDGMVVQVSRQDGLYVATTRKTAQNVALIPVLGALTKRGDLCSYGMRDYISVIDRANRSEKIAAIVLDVESPGIYQGCGVMFFMD